jgi:acyl-CoA thioester hydrolase
VHEKRIEIRWRDLDAAGHVNNAVFLTYLEEAATNVSTGRSARAGTTSSPASPSTTVESCG